MEVDPAVLVLVPLFGQAVQFSSPTVFLNLPTSHGVQVLLAPDPAPQKPGKHTQSLIISLVASNWDLEDVLVRSGQARQSVVLKAYCPRGQDT